MKALLAAALLAGAAIAAAPPGAPPVNDAAITGAGFPATLADYGFFADGAAQRPAAGVTPYRLQTPLWSDGAEKLRFAYVPKGAQARAQGAGLLDFPVGSALIKSFKLGDKLVETRVLLHRADGWVALPYQWNADQTEARLVLGGARLPLTAPGGQAISYAIPNKNQCKECHAVDGAVTPIGPKAWNLSAEWLAGFARSGRLDAVPTVARRVPLWEDRDKAPVAMAARGYLEANCAHCHNPRGAASNSGLYLGWDVTDPVQLGVGKRPVAAGRGAGNLEFDVVPGDPAHSILAYRMASLEGGVAMPEVGRSVVDSAGQAVVERWIREMKR
ncbi:SO2930 family diheme c-type cytochrome [Novosphingobium sp.]|uniref:SO2930 family diheme c-type cytochrome n=1 Tax=Novosphingobium sp. TaxID=1874826 RepID=UPI0035B24FCD